MRERALIHVAGPVGAGKTTFIVRMRRPLRIRSARTLQGAFENPEALARLLGGGLGEPLVAMALEQPRVLDQLRRSMKAKLGEVRRAPPPTPTE